MSNVLKNSNNVPSQTEPPRGTIASPNTVMTIEPVREGSRLSCSMMRASGCDMLRAYRVFRIYDNARLPLARGALPVWIRVDHSAPAAAVERRPLAFGLGETIGDRIYDGGMMAHAAMA